MCWSASDRATARATRVQSSPVRVFADDDVVHVDGRVDPLSDIGVIETELILADLQTIEKALPRLEKDARKNKDLAETVAAVQKAQAILNEGTTLFSQKDSFDLAAVRELHLMTAKPFLYVFNADESVLTDDTRTHPNRSITYTHRNSNFSKASYSATVQYRG